MADIGRQMYELIADLYPLNRSITGEGVRATLRRIAEIAPVELHEVPSGTPVLDWTVPDEWTLREAYIADPGGRRIVDAADSNLHVVGYSEPVRRTMSLEELRPHLHVDHSKPDWIPYRTSYYSRNWGFCLTVGQFEQLRDGDYEVVIDSTLAAGSLTYGEIVLPGLTEDTCLFYTHTCHPSLCNDNLSGIAVAAFLARWLAARENRLTYRLVFGPGTIGSITWLARNRSILPRIRHGLVVALLGDRGPLQYKRSRLGDAIIDRVVAARLARNDPAGSSFAFSPWGYDERQFGSPGFALPVGRLTRSAEEGYPEYHTSADNLDLIDVGSLEESLAACIDIVEIIDDNRRYRNLAPFGEPQLGKRGIYREIGGAASPELQQALLWALSLSDGEHDLVDIYARSGLPHASLREAVRLLHNAGLLAPLDE